MKLFFKLYDILSGILFLLCVLLAGILFLPQLFGIKNYIVISGSMEPIIHTGSVVYIDEKAQNIETNDIIAYQLSDGTKVVHRVISIDTNQQVMITKGDANETQDLSPVPFSNVMRRFVVAIPYLGFVLAWIKTKQGILICACGFLLFLSVGFLQSSKKKVF